VVADSRSILTGTYAIGADNRGVMTLNIAGGQCEAGVCDDVNGNAQFIEFDAAGGAGTIARGPWKKRTQTAVSTARITGDYAFGAAGLDNVNNRAAIEGDGLRMGPALSPTRGRRQCYGTDYAMNFYGGELHGVQHRHGRGSMQMLSRSAEHPTL